MNKIFSYAHSFIQNKAIKYALQKPAPNLIPRSMPKASNVDCFVITLNADDGSWSALIKGESEGKYTGEWLEDDTYKNVASLLSSETERASFECTHFLERYEFHYTSALSMLWRELLYLPYLDIYRERYSQYKFNKARLTRLDRISILKIVYEASLEDSRSQTSSIILAGKLYSNRIFFHPDKTKMFNYCRLLLDSLVASGDLEFRDSSYFLSSKALITISKHEEDERRHKDMISQQRALKWVTVGLIFVGLVQAYVSYKNIPVNGQQNPPQYENRT